MDTATRLPFNSAAKHKKSTLPGETPLALPACSLGASSSARHGPCARGFRPLSSAQR